MDVAGSEEREAIEEREMLGRGGYERVQRLDRSPSPYGMPEGKGGAYGDLSRRGG